MSQLFVSLSFPDSATVTQVIKNVLNGTNRVCIYGESWKCYRIVMEGTLVGCLKRGWSATDSAFRFAVAFLAVVTKSRCVSPVSGRDTTPETFIRWRFGVDFSGSTSVQFSGGPRPTNHGRIRFPPRPSCTSWIVNGISTVLLAARFLKSAICRFRKHLWRATNPFRSLKYIPRRFNIHKIIWVSKYFTKSSFSRISILLTPLLSISYSTN